VRQNNVTINTSIGTNQRVKEIKQSLFDSTLKLLKPFIKMLLQHGVSHAEFNELTKRAFVEVAEEHFEIPGKKQTTSRISVLTGLARKDVARIKSELEEGSSTKHTRNRPEEVVGGWVRDDNFHDKEGKPVALPIEGDVSFTALVKRYAGDVPVKAVLNELLRVGAVKQEDEKFVLCSRAYVPNQTSEERLRLLGEHATDLLETLNHNLLCEKPDSRLQLAVVYKNLPKEALLPFHKLGAKEGLKFLTDMDKHLVNYDRDHNPSVEGTGKYRAGVGLYYFEEEISQDVEK